MDKYDFIEFCKTYAQIPLSDAPFYSPDVIQEIREHDRVLADKMQAVADADKAAIKHVRERIEDAE